jgi:hypothetical protein
MLAENLELTDFVVVHVKPVVKVLCLAPAPDSRDEDRFPDVPREDLPAAAKEVRTRPLRKIAGSRMDREDEKYR